MSGQHLSYPASMLLRRPSLGTEEVLLSKRFVFPRGLASPDDVAVLLAIHRGVENRKTEWSTYFIETLTAYIVFHAWPQHSLDEINAEWIEALIAPDRVVRTQEEVEFLLHVIDVARAVPPPLSALALEQLFHAVHSGTGAYEQSRDHSRAGLSQRDIDYLYRILKGSASGGRMLLTQMEIAVLDRIDVDVAGQANHPAWRSLLRSLSLRNEDGHAPMRPWLRVRDEALLMEGTAA